MKEQQRAEAVVEMGPEDPSRPDGATDIYLIFDGRRIAKRGKPGTLHAMIWISLEPGVVVRDVPMTESESGWAVADRSRIRPTICRYQPPRLKSSRSDRFSSRTRFRSPFRAKRTGNCVGLRRMG